MHIYTVYICVPYMIASNGWTNITRSRTSWALNDFFRAMLGRPLVSQSLDHSSEAPSRLLQPKCYAMAWWSHQQNPRSSSWSVGVTVPLLYNVWLVVEPPLWKIWKSVGIMKFPIYGKTNVPNHQLDVIYCYYIFLQGHPWDLHRICMHLRWSC